SPKGGKSPSKKANESDSAFSPKLLNSIHALFTKLSPSKSPSSSVGQIVSSRAAVQSTAPIASVEHKFNDLYLRSPVPKLKSQLEGIDAVNKGVASPTSSDA